MSNKVLPNTANRDSPKIRSWGTTDKGTGQNPHEKDEFGCAKRGGVAMPIMRQTHPIGKTK
jgi:hypothetical protein